MTPRRPPEAAAANLEAASELLEADRVTAQAVLRLLGAAVTAAEDAPGAVDREQIALAIADVNHWAHRCGQIARRLHELAGGAAPRPAAGDRSTPWADSPSRSPVASSRP